jgi:hypothetical protein
MNSNIYHINFGTLIKMFVPSLVNRPKLFAMAVALLRPEVLEYDRWLTWAGDAVYRVSHNGSIISLTAMLNDKFDPVQRRIFIKNVQQQDAVRFYPEAMNRQVGFYPLAMGKQVGFRPSLEYDPSAADFTVHVPVDLKPGAPELEQKFLIRMGGQIDYYKLFAKKYQIIWIG